MSPVDEQAAHDIAKAVGADVGLVRSVMEHVRARNAVGYARLAQVLGTPWVFIGGVVMVLLERYVALPQGDANKVLIGALVPALAEASGTWMLEQLREYQARRANQASSESVAAPPTDALLVELAPVAAEFLRATVTEMDYRRTHEPGRDPAWERLIQSNRSATWKKHQL